MSDEVITEEFWNECTKNINDMEGWNFEWENKKIKVFSKKLFETSEMNTIKCFATIDYPKDLLYKVFLDVEEREKWAPNVIESKLIEKGLEQTRKVF